MSNSTAWTTPRLLASLAVAGGLASVATAAPLHPVDDRPAARIPVPHTPNALPILSNGLTLGFVLANGSDTGALNSALDRLREHSPIGAAIQAPSSTIPSAGLATPNEDSGFDFIAAGSAFRVGGNDIATSGGTGNSAPSSNPYPAGSTPFGFGSTDSLFGLGGNTTDTDAPSSGIGGGAIAPLPSGAALTLAALGGILAIRRRSL